MQHQPEACASDLCDYYSHVTYCAPVTLQELCKSCRTSCYFILFNFGARWQNVCTILVQGFILFYLSANGQSA